MAAKILEMNHFETTELSNLTVQDVDIVLELNERVFAPSKNGLFYANTLNVAPENKVIDLGTGSGILAIYAAKRGGIVSATDIEDEAIESAKKNFALNKVSVEIKKSSLFGNFSGPYDVIIANLPNEIIPPAYTKRIGQQLAQTFDGGKSGNECILSLIAEAHKYMHGKSRLYLPVHTLTDYHQVLQAAVKQYQAKLIALSELPVKAFVEENLTFYQKLNEQGIISIFKKNNNWYSYGYVYELSTKS